MTATRVLGALLALVVCAWFGLGVIQSHDVDRASALVSAPAPLGPAEAAHVTSLLHDARVLNPDAEVDLLRAQLAVRLGDPARARAILTGVVRREPMNVDAWAALARSSLENPVAFRVDVLRVRALAPVVPAS